MRRFAIVLVLGSLTFVDSAQAQPPGVRAGEILCTSQEFKDAELAAYRALVAAQHATEVKIADLITGIEKTYKDDLLRRSQKYASDQAGCRNDGCLVNARFNYDAETVTSLTARDLAVRNAQKEEVVRNEDAKKEYDAAVEKARRRYCVAYAASGSDAPTVYSGVVCSLEKPFTVKGFNGAFETTNEFTPASALHGTAHLTGGWLGMTWIGDGPYTVEGIDTDKPRIVWPVSTCVSVGSCGSGTAHIDLRPSSQDACAAPPPIARPR
jgi:hypothetical protein